MENWYNKVMVQSLNTKTSTPFAAIAYVGLGSVYGKLLIGDKAFEFFNDANVEDSIQIPWDTIYHVEGVLHRNNKIGRQIVVVLNRQGNSKRQNHLRFSSKESGKILKLVREQLRSEEVVKAPTIIRTLINKFTRRKG